MHYIWYPKSFISFWIVIKLKLGRNGGKVVIFFIVIFWMCLFMHVFILWVILFRIWFKVILSVFTKDMYYHYTLGYSTLSSVSFIH